VGLHSGGAVLVHSGGRGRPVHSSQPVDEALAEVGLRLFTEAAMADTNRLPRRPIRVFPGTTSDSVSLAWDASTDNVGVTGMTCTTAASGYDGHDFVGDCGAACADTAYTFRSRPMTPPATLGRERFRWPPRTPVGGGGGRTFSNDTDYRSGLLGGCQPTSILGRR